MNLKTLPRRRLASRPSTAEQYRSRPKARKLKPAWAALVKRQIDREVAKGTVFFRPRKGSSRKTYEEPITEAVRAGDVSLADLLCSPEISVSGKTKKRWVRAAKAGASSRA